MLTQFRAQISSFLDRIPVYGHARVWWRAVRMKRPRLAWILRFFAYLVGIFYAIKIVFILGFFGPVPTVGQLRDLNMDNASAVYSADGKLLGRYYKQNRTSTTFDQLPKHLVDALIATEDSRFYQHSGIDWMALMRVFFKTLLGGDESSGGGSTLSQQVAKNLYPRLDFPIASTPINKIREMLVARRLERAYSKQEILAVYLNTVPFPDNVFGIEVAARRFFSKPPKELTINESATLVGTLKASTFYNPRRFVARSQERRNVVLQLMVENGYLAKEKCLELKKEPLVVHYSTDYMLKEGRASHFREFLKLKILPDLLDSIEAKTGVRYDIYKDGLKIYTTLDSRLQEYAEQAVVQRMRDLQQTFDNHWAGDVPWINDTILQDAFKQTPRYQSIKNLTEEKIKKIVNTKQPITIFTYKGEKDVMMSPLDSFKHYFSLLNAGLVSMVPQTGEVKAYVGGFDFNFNQYDQVRARRQVGSTFKPFVYAAALQQGISPCEPIPNSKVTWHKYEDDWTVKDPSRKDLKPNKDKKTGKDLDDWSPENADKRYGGYYSMEGALSNSVNVATVHTIMRIGVNPVLKLAKAMGIENPIPSEPSIALGAAELSLQEMVSAFSAFPNRGHKTVPLYITRIEKADGTLIAEYKAPPSAQQKQVLEQEYADVMNNLLQAVTDGGTAGSIKWKYDVTSDAAGKTGTSQNHSDGWFIGYLPGLITGTYVGAPSPAVRFRDLRYGQGSHTALPIWGLYMRSTLKDSAYQYLKTEKFVPPSARMSDSLECGHRPWPKSSGVPSDTTNFEVMLDSLGNPIIGDPDKLKLPLLPDLNELENKTSTPEPKSNDGKAPEKNAPKEGKDTQKQPIFTKPKEKSGGG